jgi:hypothetical protein
MDQSIALAKLANLFACVAVVICGSYLLRSLSQKFQNEFRFVFRTFVCWWLSWVVWILLWAVILGVSKLTTDQILLTVLSLVGSDLNAVLLILCYLFLTRGDEYKPFQAGLDGFFIAVILAAGYAGLYLSFRPDTQLALRLHGEWALVLGAVSTILIGWGFLLRYNTRLVLVMGCVYGFAQPAVFSAVLQQGFPAPDKVPILIVMALLKMLWATAVTACILQSPTSSKSLVTSSSSLFKLGGLRQSGTIFLVVQSVLLLFIFIIFLVRFIPTGYGPGISSAIRDTSAVIAIIGVLIGVIIPKIRKWLEGKSN